MESILIILAILGTDMFFSLSAIIGYEYLGIEDSPIYFIYVVLIFVLTLLLFIKKIVLAGDKYKFRNIFPILIPLVLTIIFFLTIILNKSSDLAVRYYLLFLVFGIPAILIGVYITYKNKVFLLEKYSNILMVIFSFSLFISALTSLSNGINFSSLGGATYQTASYLGGFSYGLNLYSIFEQNNDFKFPYQKSNVYKIISFFLLPLQIIAILITGGRGGMVLVLFYSLYFLYELFHISRYKSLIKFIGLITILTVLLLSVLPYLLTIDSFNSSFQRVFSYISDTGIDMSKTSNRDVAYSTSFKLIMNSPLIGYGYFGMWKITGYPHNIFLEILQQGGIIYLVMFIFLGILLLIKIRKIIKFNESNRIILVIALYPFTMLLFSGTYQINSIFWFTISYIISYKIDYNKQIYMK